METLEIQVTTKQEAEALKEELKRRPQVKAVAVRSKRARKSVVQKPNAAPNPAPVDAVTLASEVSLAESWDSPEDARWDELLR